MGKQVLIRATFGDEKRMISYLRSIADIKLIPYFADSEADLFIDDLEYGFPKYGGTYFIWNTKYPWDFEIKRTIDGRLFISDTDSPLIEYKRSNCISGDDGRIYWAKYFAAPNGLSYDIDEFEIWYGSITKWIKKNSPGKTGQGRITYYLPEAWEELHKYEG